MTDALDSMLVAGLKARLREERMTKPAKPTADPNQVSAPIRGLDLKGRTVVIKEKCLAPQHRRGDRRLLCTEGFGCNPAAQGRAVYGTFRGEESVRFDRSDIQGLAACPLDPPSVTQKPKPERK